MLKKSGVIISKEFVKPKGFDLFLPKSLSELANLRKRPRKKTGRKLIQEQRIKREIENLSGVQRELTRLLKGQGELWVKGRYKMQRFILKSDGQKLLVYSQGRPKSPIKEVTNLETMYYALTSAAKELGLRIQ